MRRLAFTLCAAIAAYCAVAVVREVAFTHHVLVRAAGLNVYSEDVLLAAAVVGAALLRNAKPLRLRNKANTFVLAATGTYVIYQLVVVVPIAVSFFNVSPGSAVRGVAWRLGAALIFLFYVVATRYVAPLTLVRLFAFAGSVVALYVVARYVISGPAAHIEYGVVRVREIWGGATLQFGWCIFAALLVRHAWRMGWAIVALNVVALTMTNHRSGYLALGAAAIVGAFSRVKVRRRMVTIATPILVALAIGLAMSPVLGSSTLYSLATMTNPNADPNAQDRIIKSEMGIAYFAHHPLGDYVWSHEYYLAGAASPSSDWEPHNFVVQLLSEQGLIATVLFLTIMAGALAVAWRNRRQDDISNAMLAFMVFYLTFVLFNTEYLAPQSAPYLWLAVAIILARERELALHRETSRQGSYLTSSPT